MQGLIRMSDNTGITPLHRAVLNGNHQIVRQLLVAKIDPNKASNSGITPLCRAMFQFDQEMIELLLTAGADKR